MAAMSTTQSVLMGFGPGTSTPAPLVNGGGIDGPTTVPNPTGSLGFGDGVQPSDTASSGGGFGNTITGASIAAANGGTQVGGLTLPNNWFWGFGLVVGLVLIAQLGGVWEKAAIGVLLLLLVDILYEFLHTNGYV